MQPQPVHWQFCRAGQDITSQPLYAEDDADEARAWTQDAFCVVALAKDTDIDAWRINTSDGRLPDDAHEETFTRAADALDYVGAFHGIAYDPTSAEH